MTQQFLYKICLKKKYKSSMPILPDTILRYEPHDIVKLSKQD